MCACSQPGAAVTDYRNWLVAIRAPQLGGERLRQLTRRVGGVDPLLRMTPAELSRHGLAEAAIDWLRHPDPAVVDADLDWLSQPGHHLITSEDERFPPLLGDIPSAPAALFVAGQPDVLWQPQLAVIGSRNPTAGGRDNGRLFAAELARRGLTVTSGLASGIDSEAHAAALDAGGLTVAVLGTGPDIVYPDSGRDLAARIRETGVVVSEFPPGTPARRQHFPSRNRIISGLSLGVLVVEAGLRSGTLITARMAASQGREVFALPGSIHNPLAKGCHRLIREGAKLVESVDDVLQEVTAMAGQLAAHLQAELRPAPGESSTSPLELAADDPQLLHDPDYQRLWSCLGHDPRPIDRIIERSGLTARAVSAMLLMLELRGMVEAHPGGSFSRKTRGQ